MKDELNRIDGDVRRVLGRLGLRDVDVMLRLRDEWDELAGAPWAGVSQPLGLQGGELVVEAAVPGLVGTLRYGEQALVGTLSAALDSDAVKVVKVVPPRGSRAGGQTIQPT